MALCLCVCVCVYHKLEFYYRVSESGSTVASVCLSVHLSICFHFVFWTDYPLTLTFCMGMGHDHSSPGIEGQRSKCRRCDPERKPKTILVYLLLIIITVTFIEHHTRSYRGSDSFTTNINFGNYFATGLWFALSFCSQYDSSIYALTRYWQWSCDMVMASVEQLSATICWTLSELPAAKSYIRGRVRRWPGLYSRPVVGQTERIPHTSLPSVKCTVCYHPTRCMFASCLVKI